MQKQLQVWKLISRSLHSETPVMLLYVLESKGSSPGRQGFFMAVNAKGEMEGSIGGGIMEHKFVEMAKDKLRNEESERSIRKQIHDKSAAKNQSGMICSGEQMVLIYSVRKDEEDVITKIIKCLEENKNGKLQLSPSGISFERTSPSFDFNYQYQSDEDWRYEEKIGHRHHLFIIGAGHCALALSKIMRLMDFYIHLYDDREGLNTFEQNEWAHGKQVVQSYEQLKELIPSGEHFVVVMTMGYRTDDIVVRALLDKDFKYFGLLGSATKIEKMFSDYRKEGISDERLKRIHAPVGLNIHSQTPEEIAVSIAAEIIRVKNKLVHRR